MTDERADVRVLIRMAGLDATSFRTSHIEASIDRSLRREGVADIPALLRLLSADPAARRRLRRSIAVSRSGLFRDPEQFDLLERSILPDLLAHRKGVAVWSAGCADGSELYSVALVLERLGALDHSHLVGSDLLEENVATAARGVYGDVVIPPAVRARTRWEQRDLLRDGPPVRKFRLVLCRNVAIYLSASARVKLHLLLARSLSPGGVLLVGRSERVSAPASLGLRPLAAHAYRRMP